MAGLISCKQIIVLMAAGLLPLQARAETLVDVELVIAADVSISMDREEKRLQQEGFARALRDPEIVRAIQGGSLGRIAVVYFEWGGEKQQRVVVPWTLIDGAASAHRFAERLERRSPAKFLRGTSLSSALEKAEELLRQSGFSGARRVVNISGDGMNNKGPEIEPIRRALIGSGVTINGLPIVYKGLLEGVIEGPDTNADPKSLIGYFEDHVIGGPYAFVEPVVAMQNYAEAIHRKLLREIGLPIYSDLKANGQTAAIEAEPPAPKP
ncbi:DUF1194 domain-containing protein [Hyphomicrobium sp. LHD-15]|uniref:DUF1194 domain-containing protein n=1 Tax=Hyphomicrobium sp. LHD-15 TaxID=3072142 RepID=UPI00280FDBA8|nr:DUF1194 domain-containing protein [Hyphomicrobium sp. LHD-15]MDQ8697441.1 DUF1194 domain-containing protein [Hyphomicrobium sp. LHD-15]